ncbi:MAG TPA: PAS domain-containing sensor histidine kinase [Anaerolineae bacterium]|nr:PAS domain-containing sensor histidine kinase [Anaerolineae bacterium]
MIYTLVSGLWILFSDRLLEVLIIDHALLISLSIIKGWAFVAVTAALLYALIERDVRQQHVTNIALQDSESRFRAIADHIPVGVGVSSLADDTGPILYTNNKFVEMFGYTLSEISSFAAWMLRAYPNDAYRQQVRDWWKADVRQGRANSAVDAITREYSITCRDGSEKTVEITFSVVADRLYAIFNDVTQRQRYAKELEARVIERTRELAQANEQLTELDRLKSKFVSDVSHELRTPIANLKLYIDLLERGQPDKQAHYITILQQQIKRVAELVDDILDLARLESHKQQGLTPRPIQLNTLIAPIVTAHQPRAEASALTLSFVPLENLPLTYGDANQLAQVVTNLLANALNYTQRGTIEVRTLLREQQIGLQINDAGRGIAPEDLPHIFERFYRGRHTHHTDVPGTGLGLAIVKEIVELHHGQIEVESQLDRGTTFTVWLPVHSPD